MGCSNIFFLKESDKYSVDLSRVPDLSIDPQGGDIWIMCIFGGVVNVGKYLTPIDYGDLWSMTQLFRETG